MATAYADLSPLAKLVLYLESLPDPDDTPSPMVEGRCEGAAVKRTQLRDRLGQIITIDRADTNRSISNI